MNKNTARIPPRVYTAVFGTPLMIVHVDPAGQLNAATVGDTATICCVVAVPGTLGNWHGSLISTIPANCSALGHVASPIPVNVGRTI